MLPVARDDTDSAVLGRTPLCSLYSPPSYSRGATSTPPDTVLPPSCRRTHTAGSAPAGSYTKRLFDDSTLLRSKLVEEVRGSWQRRRVISGHLGASRVISGHLGAGAGRGRGARRHRL